MAKKEKKKNYLKKEKIIFSSVFGVIVVALASLLIFQIIANNFYLKIDGESIDRKELEIYIYEYKASLDGSGITDWEADYGNGASIRENVINYAIEGLVDTKIQYNEAVRRGLSITDEQKQQAKDSVADYKEYLGEAVVSALKLTDDDLLKMIEEQHMINALFEDVGQAYAFDQFTFSQYRESYLEYYRDDLYDYLIEYVYAETEEIALEAKARMLAGEDYETIFKELSIDYTGENEIGEKSLSNFDVPDDFKEVIYELGIGHATDPTPIDDGYMVVVLRKIVEPDVEALIPEMLENFEYEEKYNLYMEAKELWVAAAKVEVNSNRIFSIKFAKETL